MFNEEEFDLLKSMIYTRQEGLEGLDIPRDMNIYIYDNPLLTLQSFMESPFLEKLIVAGIDNINIITRLDSKGRYEREGEYYHMVYSQSNSSIISNFIHKKLSLLRTIRPNVTINFIENTTFLNKDIPYKELVLWSGKKDYLSGIRSMFLSKKVMVMSSELVGRLGQRNKSYFTNNLEYTSFVYFNLESNKFFSPKLPVGDITTLKINPVLVKRLNKNFKFNGKSNVSTLLTRKLQITHADLNFIEMMYHLFWDTALNILFKEKFNNEKTYKGTLIDIVTLYTDHFLNELHCTHKEMDKYGFDEFYYENNNARINRDVIIGGGGIGTKVFEYLFDNRGLVPFSQGYIHNKLKDNLYFNVFSSNFLYKRVNHFNLEGIENFSAKLMKHLPDSISTYGDFLCVNKNTAREYIRTVALFDDDTVGVHNMNRGGYFKLSQSLMEIPKVESFNTSYPHRRHRDFKQVFMNFVNKRIETKEDYQEIIAPNLADKASTRSVTIFDCRDNIFRNNLKPEWLTRDFYHYKLSYNGADKVSICFNLPEYSKGIFTINGTGSNYEITPSFFAPPAIVAAIMGLIKNNVMVMNAVAYVDLNIDNFLDENLGSH